MNDGGDRGLALVTGAPGWLGTRLVEVLRHGLADVPALARPGQVRRIRCLVRRGVSSAPLTAAVPDLELTVGDLGDPESLGAFFRGAEGATLFHLAGVIHPRRVREFYEVNVEGTRRLLAAAVASGVRRIVAISSNSPAGCNPSPAHVFDEDAPYRPYMHYGRSKQRAEELLLEASAAGRIEAVVLRPCWFYGPGQPARQSRFFRMIRAGYAPIVGGGHARRSLSYVDNTCQAILLAERAAAAPGRIYWVADRRPYTMNEIVDTVERLLEDEFGLSVAHRRLRLPGFVDDLALGVDRVLQGIGLYHQSIHVLSEMGRTIACSVERAERELGYAPTVELEEGMRRSIRWCLAHGQQI
jgi:nucleoside-diphosphate-sugar epimerase